MRKKFLLLIVIVISASLLSACYDYSDVEDTTVVSGIAVDVSEKGYKITAEFLSASSAEEVSIESKTFAAEGRTLYEAMENLNNSSGKKPVFSHCQVIFISKEFADRGISDLLELIFHYGKIRLSAVLTVVSEGEASEIFECEMPLYDALSYGVFDLMKQGNIANATFPSSQVYTSLNSLEKIGKEMTVPIVSVVDGKVKQCELSGIEIFKGEKSAGRLTNEESLFYMILTGKLSSGEITLPYGRDYASAELKNLSVSYKVGDDLRTFFVDVHMTVSMREVPDDYDISVDSEKKEFEELFALKTKEKLEDLFSHVKESYNVDIFGLGDMIYHKKPGEWNGIKDDWYEIFGETSLDINVDCIVSDAGKTSKNTNENGA